MTEIPLHYLMVNADIAVYLTFVHGQEYTHVYQINRTGVIDQRRVWVCGLGFSTYKRNRYESITDYETKHKRIYGVPIRRPQY